jgi:hypothetical protein
MSLWCVRLTAVFALVSYLLEETKLTDRTSPTLRRGVLLLTCLLAVLAAGADWRVHHLERPRSLTPVQQQALVESVRAFTPERNTIRINWPIEDVEAKSYAAQFERTFRSAGWPAMSNPFQSSASLVFTGVSVGVPTNTPKREIGEAILAALHRAQVPDVKQKPYPTWNEVEITVGSKVSR